MTIGGFIVTFRQSIGNFIQDLRVLEALSLNSRRVTSASFTNNITLLSAIEGLSNSESLQSVKYWGWGMGVLFETPISNATSKTSGFLSAHQLFHEANEFTEKVNPKLVQSSQPPLQPTSLLLFSYSIYIRWRVALPYGLFDCVPKKCSGSMSISKRAPLFYL